MVVFSDWTCPGMPAAIWTSLELHFKERFHQKARALHSKNIWPKRNSCIFFIPIWPLKMSNCWFFLALLFIPSSHHQSFVFTCNYSVGLVGNPHIYLRPEQPEGLPAVLLWGRTRRETVAELWGVPPGPPPPDVSRRPTVSITGKINTAEEWSRHFDLDSFIKGCSHQEAFNIGFIVS